MPMHGTRLRSSITQIGIYVSTCYRVFVAVLAASLLVACSPGAPSQSVPTAQSVLLASPTPAAATLSPEDQRPSPSMITPSSSPSAATTLVGTFAIDGSSTVFPITEAATTAFRAIAPEVSINLGVSGTGGGFRRFCDGETSLSNASRPIKSDEAAACAANGIAFIELPLAYDGISLAVNQANTWAQCMTVAELRQLWEPSAEGQFPRWQDVRPAWPATPLTLYGAGGDSGTFDYFTAAIVGSEGAIRPDYVASEDDYLIAQDLADDRGGLGFFGYTYIVEYAADLRAIAVDSGAGCVIPSAATIADGSYQPLSRPLFVYVRPDHLDRPEVRAFLDFYLNNAPSLVEQVRAIPLPDRAYDLIRTRLTKRITGSVFVQDVPIGVSITELLELEGD